MYICIKCIKILKKIFFFCLHKLRYNAIVHLFITRYDSDKKEINTKYGETRHSTCVKNLQSIMHPKCLKGSTQRCGSNQSVVDVSNTFYICMLYFHVFRNVNLKK